MIKSILETFAGIILTGGGIGGILYTLKLMERHDPAVFAALGSILLIAGGVFLFFKGGRQNIHHMKWDTVRAPHEEMSGILEKNNELVKDYYKTMENRDKLKVLSIAGKAEEQSS